jgi:hypothetical protein
MQRKSERYTDLTDEAYRLHRGTDRAKRRIEAWGGRTLQSGKADANGSLQSVTYDLIL